VALLGAGVPGTVVQRMAVTFTPGAPWHAELTKTLAGRGDGQTFFQWNLTVENPSGQPVYASPPGGVPFTRVEKASGGRLYFPVADASFAGAGTFMNARTQQLVVVSHEASADCGMARVDVLGYDTATRSIAPALSVTNGCDLSARIVHEKGGDMLAVSGPYYAANAALCCPTKSRVTALFRFRAGRWTQHPRYFTVRRSP
jgi:hypothetical protein